MSPCKSKGAFLVAQMVKDLPALQVQTLGEDDPLGGDDPLEKGMAARSSTLAWEIPWTEEPGGLQTSENLKVD